MDRRRVEQRHCRVLLPHQQADLGAAEDDRLGAAGHQLCHDLAVALTGLPAHDSLAQLVVDHAVHVGALRRVGQHHVETVLAQPAGVEVLLHGEGRGEQADPGVAGRPHPPCRGVADVEQRDGHRGADLVGDPVHRVGGQQQALRPRAFQALRRLDQHRGRAVPVPVVLHPRQGREVDAVQDEAGRVQATEPAGRPLVEQAVVLRRARPAHPAQDPEKPHGPTLAAAPPGRVTRPGGIREVRPRERGRTFERYAAWPALRPATTQWP